jgi:hypothetical protein
MWKVKMFLALVVVVGIIALSASWSQQSQTDPAGTAESMPWLFGGLEDPEACAEAFGMAFRCWPVLILWGIIQYIRGGRSVK